MDHPVGSNTEIAAVKSHDTTEQLITQARRGRRRSRLDVPRGVGAPVRGLRVAPGQRRVVAQLEHLRRARPKPRQQQQPQQLPEGWQRPRVGVLVHVLGLCHSTELVAEK